MKQPNLMFLQQLVDTAYEKGLLRQALVYAKSIYEIAPSYQAFFDYALIARDLSLHQQALKAFDSAIALDDQQLEAHIERSLTLYDLGYLQQAYQYLVDKRTLLLDQMPWALLAILTAELRQFNEALFYAHKAISKDADAWSYQARALVHQMAGSYDLARFDFQQAINLDPYNPDLWNSYGLLFEEIMAFEHALEVYDTAINHFELQEHILYLNRAKIHHTLQHFSQAITDCELALEKLPDSGDTWFLFATFLHENGDLAAALIAYNRSLRYIKKDPTLHFCKAQLLEELGNVKQAQASYQRALRLDVHNTEIRLAFASFLMRNNLSLQAHAIIQEGIAQSINTNSCTQLLEGEFPLSHIKT